MLWLPFCVLLKEPDRRLTIKQLVVWSLARSSPAHRCFSSRGCHDMHFLSAEPFWELGNWTHCSATCGHLGARVRRPQCVMANGQEVSESLCNHLQKPLAGYQPCNLQDCPSRYVESRFLSRQYWGFAACD